MLFLFGQHLVRPGLVDAQFEASLHELYDARELADYHVATESLSEEEARMLVEKADGVVTAVAAVVAQQLLVP